MCFFVLARRTTQFRSALFLLCVLLVALLPLGCPPPEGPDVTGDDLIAPATLAGVVNARNVTIPENTTTTIAGDVEIAATGDVNIAGTLSAEPSEGDGYSITVRAEGNVVIEGTVEAGTAGDVASSKADYAEGMNGGSVVVRSGGDIIVGRYSNLIAKNGTDGSSGTNPAPGGKGGNIIFEAGGNISIYGSLTLGDGGWGGLCSETLRNARESYSSRGGDSGFIYVETLDNVDWPAFDSALFAIDEESYNARNDTGTILGGIGGTGGRVNLAFDPNDCGTNVGPASNVVGVTTIRAAAGGRGWLRGGDGGSIFIDGSCYWLVLNGVDLEGIAGDGGDITFSEFDVFIPEFYVKRFRAAAGNGGSAQVSTANGRLSGTRHLAGGRAGNAVARGGKGAGTLSPVTHSGGNGGDARALGGGGGEGWPLECDDPVEAGGDGGPGGNSEAYAGDGGDGDTPGMGGTASVFEFEPFSAGANGGRGVPGGAGGAAGNWSISDGRAGIASFFEDRDIVITVSGKGVAGSEGDQWNPNTECGN